MLAIIHTLQWCNYLSSLLCEWMRPVVGESTLASETGRCWERYGRTETPTAEKAKPRSQFKEFLLEPYWRGGREDCSLCDKKLNTGPATCAARSQTHHLLSSQNSVFSICPHIKWFKSEVLYHYTLWVVSESQKQEKMTLWDLGCYYSCFTPILPLGGWEFSLGLLFECSNVTSVNYKWIESTLTHKTMELKAITLSHTEITAPG
jgi:hypothetical protein